MLGVVGGSWWTGAEISEQLCDKRGPRCREIEDGELAVVFFCGAVVGLCGAYFVMEGADIGFPAGSRDFDPPFLRAAAPVDSLVF